MGNLRTPKPRTLEPLNLENTGDLSTDQHRNTANTISLGKDTLSHAKQTIFSLGSGQFDHTRNYPEGGEGGSHCLPCRANFCNRHRIQYPPSAYKYNHISNLRRSVTNS